MNVLVIGLGSIGKRHASNIQLLSHNLSIISSKEQLPEPFQQCRHFKTLTAAMQHVQFDAAVICTPTTQHDEMLIGLLKHQVPFIYIEKPISHSLENIAVIQHLAKSYKNKIVVGYDLHFDPGMQHVKKLLRSNSIGKVVTANAFVGQHLAQWRPYEDYRKGMSAKIATGGGVLSDLIHEFEYLYRLFGPVKKVASNIINTGSLEIETEEAADVLLKFENDISAVVHLDYLQPKIVRYCIITGTNGTITWNLAEKTVHTITNVSAETFSYKEFERNDRFVEAMRSFLGNEADDRFATLDDGIESLRIVLNAKANTL